MIRRPSQRAAAAFALLFLAGCGDDTHSPVTHVLEGHALGTAYSLQIVAAEAAIDRQSVQDEVARTLHEVDTQFSNWREDSALTRFNRSVRTDWQPVERDLCERVAAALELSRRTGGAFDPTVAPLVNAWGFGAESPTARPDEATIRLLLESVGYQLVETDCEQPAMRKLRSDVALDLSGYAKGWAVDRLAAVLEDAGVSRYLVDIGGEIRARGHNEHGKPWTVGIENPVLPSARPLRVLALSSGGLATSGDYRNRIETADGSFAHIIDPGSGLPVDHGLTSVTVVAATAAEADALATAILVMGPARGLEFANAQGLAASLQVSAAGILRTESTAALDAYLAESL